MLNVREQEIEFKLLEINCNKTAEKYHTANRVFLFPFMPSVIYPVIDQNI